MLALSDAIDEGTIPNAEIAIVISDKPGAPGLALAKKRGIQALAIERRGRNRERRHTARQLGGRGDRTGVWWRRWRGARVRRHQRK